MSLKRVSTDPNRPSTDRPFRIGNALSGQGVAKGALRSRFRRLATRVFSSATRCPTCDERNPADSRYCSACGGTLHLPPHLASCPRCGVVGQVTATVCFWCHGQLPGHKADASVAGRAFRFLRRRQPLMVGSAAVLAAIVVLGYAASRQRPAIEASPPPAASSESSRRDAPVENRPPAETPEAKAAAPAVPRPQAIETGRAGERKPPRLETCTEGVAALGLCATEAKAAGAAIKNLRTTDAGKEGGREPSDPQTCTEAAAAVGLCKRPE
jgi:hypothetical protein